MARVPASEGQPRRHHRVRRRGRLARHHRRAAATRSWACSGIENGVTRFHQVRVPAENRLGGEGQGLKIALTTLNTGRLSIPAICAAAGKWSPQDRTGVVGANACSGAGRRRARGGGAPRSPSSPRRRSRSSRCSTSPPSWPTPDRKDIRIEAALAKLWSSEMAWRVADELVQIRGGRGYETADSLPPGRAGDAGRADAARHADQPDLRGLHRDHAPADRPRGRRRPPRRGRRPHRPDADLPRKAQAAGGPAASTPAGCRSWSPAGRPADVVRRVRPARAPTCGSSSAPRRKLARQTFYGMARWQGGLEYAAGVPGSDRRHRRRAVRHVRRLRRARRCSAPTTRAGRAASSSPTPSAPGPAAGRAPLRRLWRNTDAADRPPRRPRARRGATPGSRTASSTRPRAPAPGSPRRCPPTRWRTSRAASSDRGCDDARRTDGEPAEPNEEPR